MQKGSQHVCVESPGLHELNFVNPCVYFGSSVLKIDTSNTLVQNYITSLMFCQMTLMHYFSVFSSSNSSDHLSFYFCSLSILKERSINLKDL